MPKGAVSPRKVTEVAGLRGAHPAVTQALACLEDPDYSLGELERILRSDQAVAARIVRLADAAYFGFRSEVQTVGQAVALLAHGRIRTLLYRIEAEWRLNELDQGQASDLRQASQAAAAVAGLLSELLGREDPGEMRLAGLLHNAGEWLLGHKGKGWGMPVGRAGRILLENWSLPPVYGTVAEFCQTPLDPDCPAAYRSRVWLVHAGLHLAQSQLGGGAADGALARIAAPVREALDLDVGVATEILGTLPQRMALEQPQVRL